MTRCIVLCESRAVSRSLQRAAGVYPRGIALHGYRATRRDKPGGSPGRKRRGLSLFEVIVALAIFMGSIAAIGQLVSTGVRGAVQARLQSQAVIRCESKMAEIVSGYLPLRSGATNVPFPDDSSWNWSVAISSGPHDGLYVVEVTVTHPSGTLAGNQSYALRRLVRDPQLELDAYAKQQEDAANAASSTSGSSTSGGSSSSGGSK